MLEERRVSLGLVFSVSRVSWFNFSKKSRAVVQGFHRCDGCVCRVTHRSFYFYFCLDTLQSIRTAIELRGVFWGNVGLLYRKGFVLKVRQVVDGDNTAIISILSFQQVIVLYRGLYQGNAINWIAFPSWQNRRHEF